jgi:hypothetical protein
MSFTSTMLAVAMISALCLSGCGADNPGTWPIDKVETQVMKGAKLTKIALSPSGEAGVITGTGKDETGETYQITVKQDADAKQIDWDAKGDRGTTLDGLYGR